MKRSRSSMLGEIIGHVVAVGMIIAVAVVVMAFAMILFSLAVQLVRATFG